MLAFQGELAALFAAFLWASSSVVYSRLGEQLSPLFLNFLKGAIALFLLGITLLITSNGVPYLPRYSIIILTISGVIGVGFGDTVFFSSLKYLGARRALLFETLAPPLAAIIALIFLQEALSVYSWLGIGLTLVGVATVISERASNQDITRNELIVGSLLGLGGAIAQAVGAVLSRVAFTDFDVSPLWSTTIRLTAGTLFLIPLLYPLRQELQIPSLKWSWRLWTIIFLTAFASTYLAIWLQQISLKFTATGIAQTLSSTSPLFVLPIVAFLKEPITLRAVGGVIISIAGIALLFIY
ncbi:DMT family transporter [Euhalothece natronophila Z-M001]|uniref:DMT family transporter n=1 Tax=Euhalothece natronophila Z-M001 TaxID=522448 RepID=A0A5B8NM70_9CHRO|nr:DMT family transporter [Euhalothece natronophila]QDZ39179.1 DMT family transporter [Euhalothece natronophila Z-M001]